ncbi:E3 ubiquitin-protein ligase TRIM39-like isoform X9 [Gallus gallus]|uniref:E3 ubiquitin-protein ligase TRIM39-like isoform X9 n=1 Tax=Gallus gallus TaxID=9031 RepID=UPI001AE784CE|nr:E3 ubiquitin-protein ligase TRIM39-like isoform X9 [Gallus gallus]
MEQNALKNAIVPLQHTLSLSPFFLSLFFFFFPVNRSKDPERGLLIPDNSKGLLIPDNSKEDTKISTSEKIDEEKEGTNISISKVDKEIESLRRRIEYQEKLFFLERLILDADTAHPRLEVFDGGKSVKDTGTMRNVAMNSTRFDSHIFILATEGFITGKHYWEVDVGKKNNWKLGVASEAVTRKGSVILCPRNGFWVMALSDGIEYWACTDPWTRLNVRSKPQKIGILLDISAGQLTFYDIQSEMTLYTFSIAESDKKGKLFPFFSVGSSVGKKDPEPLKLCQ